MNNYNRLRTWIEQGNVTIPQLFFQFYKELHITDDEAILLMHLIAFHEEGNDFPTPYDLKARTHFAANDISMKLQRLLQKGFLEITQGVDVNGKIFEKYSIYPLWDRILMLLETKQLASTEADQKNEEGEIYSMFEQEFGRLLSPIELETIGMWIDNDHHSPAMIKEALKEAVLAGKISLRYIDRILFEWKKKNFTSVKQVEQHSEQFRKRTMTQHQHQHQPTSKPAPKAAFYNWLEERD
ncbi:DnaD domain-containing protein [Solibacillus sp. CAU 1738]|uniref:DnaD domain-containing protein n=1 Tax=Solibacillus sp. CAU 1738 TaxID=3140363 RepID=UPI0032619C5B